MQRRRIPTYRVHPAPARQAHGLEQALTFAWQLVGTVEALALALAELGDIDLPPATRSAADQSHLQTAATLYLASELEAACLVPAVETLAGVFASGGIRTDLGEAAGALHAFWRSRNERFAPEERRAIYARLFGASTETTFSVQDGSNTAFENLMIDLVELLYNWGTGPSQGEQLREDFALRRAASQLAENIINRSGGMAAFAARDLLHTIQQSLDILKHPAVQRAVGTHSVWQAVDRIAQLYLNTDVDVASHINRGQSGMVILAWLGEVYTRLDMQNGRLMQPNHPVVTAAATWLQSSLALYEQRGEQVPSHPPPSPPTQPPYAPVPAYS